MMQKTKMMRMKKMSGDNPKHNPFALHQFKELYAMQVAFQERISRDDVNSNLTLPYDDPIMFQYHMTAMVEELGEVLKADKRWKTHRNTTHDPDEKLDEIADCFITMMNVSIWSGLSHDEIFDGIKRKIRKNHERVNEQRS